MDLKIIFDIIESSWQVLLNSSIFMLMGFTIAGLLKGFLPKDFINKHLGKGKYLSVIKASAFGVPLPLCSCGVLPAAAGLKEEGANKGATAAFLISTPETGVDSIAVSWALLDPIMTIFRPIASFITAIITGFTINILGIKDKEEIHIIEEHNHKETSSCSSGCCSIKTEVESNPGIYDRLRTGMKFAFGDLFEDISKWFMVGVVIAGAIDVFISPALISNYLGEGIVSMLVVLVVSVPLYICATASTPIAAALALKGLSPGAALVLLLAGPATNAAALAVITKILGKKSTVVYVVSIAITSILMGLGANYIYKISGLSTRDWVSSGGTEEHGILFIVSAIMVLLLFGRILFMDIMKMFRK